MKIANDPIAELRVAMVPLALAEPFAAGRWIIEAIHNVVVEIRGADRTGIGFAFVFTPGDARTIEAAILALQDAIIGRDPLDTLALHADLRVACNFVGAGGPALSAVGAIDLALWDLKGQILGVSVQRLLGSSLARVPAYASGGAFNKDLPDLEQEIKSYLDRGFSAIKIKLPPDPKEACRRIVTVRGWIGDGIKMMYDSNQQQASPKDALEIARCAAAHGAFWHEEPWPSSAQSSLSNLC